jgi:hypothetical protein
MATISAATTERIYTIDAFRGLHENPDGDTKLKKGEAAAMVNFRITRDGNLKKRPGTARIVGLLNYSYDDSDPDLPTYTINEPSSLKMYSSISIDSDGFYQGTGDVTVSGGNFDSYIGYYWIRTHDTAYILRSVNDDGTLLFSQVALVFTGSDDKVKTMWSGFVNFTEYLVVACHSLTYLYAKPTPVLLPLPENFLSPVCTRLALYQPQVSSW